MIIGEKRFDHISSDNLLFLKKRRKRFCPSHTIFFVTDPSLKYEKDCFRIVITFSYQCQPMYSSGNLRSSDTVNWKYFFCRFFLLPHEIGSALGERKFGMRANITLSYLVTVLQKVSFQRRSELSEVKKRP